MTCFSVMLTKFSGVGERQQCLLRSDPMDSHGDAHSAYEEIVSILIARSRETINLQEGRRHEPSASRIES